MSTTLIHPEDSTMLFTATTTAKSSGDMCVMTSMIGVAKVAIAAAGTGAVYISGVHTLTKRTDAPWTLGAPLYYASATGSICTHKTSNYYAGRAYATATTTQATGSVVLNFGSTPVGV